MIRATRTGHPCEGTVHADHLPPSVNLTTAREDGWVIETLTDLPDDLNLPGDAARLLAAVQATDLPWTLTRRPSRTGKGTETVIDIRDIDPQGGWSNPWKDWRWDTHGTLQSSYITVDRALELLAGHTKKKAA